MAWTWSRHARTFRARLTPGGPVVTCTGYFAHPDAPMFQGDAACFERDWWLQLDNDEANSDSVGEVTKPGWKGRGQRGAGSFTKYSAPWIHHRDGSRPVALHADGTMDTVDTRVDPGPPAGEPHGTPAAWLCEPEEDGTFYTKVYDPLTITTAEFASLPECVQARWDLDEVDCIDGAWGDGSDILWDDEGHTLAWECAECDVGSWGDGSKILWDDEGHTLEWECPADEVERCTMGAWDDDTLMVWDDDGTLIEWECPGETPIDAETEIDRAIELEVRDIGFEDVSEGFSIDDEANVFTELDEPAELLKLDIIALEDAAGDPELVKLDIIELEEGGDDAELVVERIIELEETTPP